MFISPSRSRSSSVSSNSSYESAYSDSDSESTSTARIDWKERSEKKEKLKDRLAEVIDETKEVVKPILREGVKQGIGVGGEYAAANIHHPIGAIACKVGVSCAQAAAPSVVDASVDSSGEISKAGGNFSIEKGSDLFSRLKEKFSAYFNRCSKEKI